MESVVSLVITVAAKSEAVTDYTGALLHTAFEPSGLPSVAAAFMPESNTSINSCLCVSVATVIAVMRHAARQKSIKDREP